jgi:heme A synthase
MGFRELSSRALLLGLSVFGALLVFLWLFIKPNRYRRSLESRAPSSITSLRWMILILGILVLVGIIVEVLFGIKA